MDDQFMCGKHHNFCFCFGHEITNIYSGRRVRFNRHAYIYVYNGYIITRKLIPLMARVCMITWLQFRAPRFTFRPANPVNIGIHLIHIFIFLSRDWLARAQKSAGVQPTTCSRFVGDPIRLFRSCFAGEDT